MAAVERGRFNWPALLLIPIAVPAALIAGLLPFGRSRKRTPEEVAVFIRDFLEARGGERDWDDFTSIPITDPWLDRVRREAIAIDLPLDEAGRAVLERLLARIEARR